MTFSQVKCFATAHGVTYYQNWSHIWDHSSKAVNPFYGNINSSMDLDIYSILNRSTVYAPQPKNETPLTLLPISITIFQFIKYINKDEDGVNLMALFNVLKKGGEAKKRNLDYACTIEQLRIQLRDNNDLSEEVLIKAATIGYESSSTALPINKTRGDKDENYGCLNTETEEACGVEGCVYAQ